MNHFNQMNIDLDIDLERDQFFQDHIENDLANLSDIEENNTNPYYLPESELTNFINNSLFIIFSKDNNFNRLTEKQDKINDSDENKLKTSLAENNKESSPVQMSEEIKESSTHNYFSENEINILIRQFNISKELKLNLLLEADTNFSTIQKIKRVLEMTRITRGKRIKLNLDYETINQRGRKLKQDETIRNHNQYSPDNIISKIINIIYESILDFINNLINAVYNDEEKRNIFDELNLSKLKSNKNLKQIIKKNNYDIRLNFRKKNEILKLLDSSLKDNLSIEISAKYDKNNFPSNYNELIINKLLNEENNKVIFQFILEGLKIEEYIDIFIHKKKLKDFPSYSLLSKEQKNLIKGNIGTIEKYINKIYQNDKKYFYCFSLIIYNFRKYITNKESRNSQKKEPKEKFKIIAKIQN